MAVNRPDEPGEKQNPERGFVLEVSRYQQTVLHPLNSPLLLKLIQQSSHRNSRSAQRISKILVSEAELNQLPLL